ncbi:MAG: hypothetical protein JST10_15575 [Bacteroidetes bacterium]|nr:hypothetical protein [Bacteroidota bacterium]
MAVKLKIKISEPELRKLVAELPEQYREVLLLYCLNNLTKKGVSEKMNLSYGVTRNRLSKGIYLLKKILDQEEMPELLLS